MPATGMAPSWVTHDSSTFIHVSSHLATDRNYNNLSLHKLTISAITAANSETSTNTFKGVLCAPSACASTAISLYPEEDSFSPTSKGYLSTSLSSNANGHPVAVYHSFSNEIGKSRPPRHLPAM